MILLEICTLGKNLSKKQLIRLTLIENLCTVLRLVSLRKICTCVNNDPKFMEFYVIRLIYYILVFFDDFYYLHKFVNLKGSVH